MDEFGEGEAEYGASCLWEVGGVGGGEELYYAKLVSLFSFVQMLSWWCETGYCVFSFLDLSLDGWIARGLSLPNLMYAEIAILIVQICQLQLPFPFYSYGLKQFLTSNPYSRCRFLPSYSPSRTSNIRITRLPARVDMHLMRSLLSTFGIPKRVVETQPSMA